MALSASRGLGRRHDIRANRGSQVELKQRGFETQIGDVMDWAQSSLAADLSADAFAKRAAVSPRNFNRAFMDEMTTTPARFVEGIRVEAARILLEPTSLTSGLNWASRHKPANQNAEVRSPAGKPQLEHARTEW